MPNEPTASLKRTTLFACVAISLGLSVACSPAAAPAPTVAPPAPPAASPVSQSSPPTAAPSTAAASPVPAAASPSPSTASPSPAVASSPAAAASPASVSPSPVAAASPAASTAGGAIRLTIVPEGSEARFRAREQLAGRSLPNDAIGRTKQVSGTIALRPDGTVDSAGSRVTVDLASLATDVVQRDGFIKRNTLQTDQYPTAVFVPNAATGLPSPLPTSGDLNFTLSGDLTVHGVTKPATWTMTGRATPDGVSGTGTTRVTLPDFGMEKPNVRAVLSIEDDIYLELDFQTRRAAP